MTLLYKQTGRTFGSNAPPVIYTLHYSLEVAQAEVDRFRRRLSWPSSLAYWRERRLP